MGIADAIKASEERIHSLSTVKEEDPNGNGFPD